MTLQVLFQVTAIPKLFQDPTETFSVVLWPTSREPLLPLLYRWGKRALGTSATHPKSQSQACVKGGVLSLPDGQDLSSWQLLLIGLFFLTATLWDEKCCDHQTHNKERGDHPGRQEGWACENNLWGQGGANPYHWIGGVWIEETSLITIAPLGMNGGFKTKTAFTETKQNKKQQQLTH